MKTELKQAIVDLCDLENAIFQTTNNQRLVAHAYRIRQALEALAGREEGGAEG